MSKLYKRHSIRIEPESYVYHIPAPHRAMPGAVIEEAVAEEEVEEPAFDAEANLRSQALDIIREAEQYSQDIREQAERDAEQLHELARKDGYRKGYEQGRFQALAENEKALDEVQELMKALDRGRENLFHQYEQHLIDLALDIARRVVADRIEQDDESFVRIFKKAVEGLSGQKIVRLTVSEHEIQFATEHAEYLRSMIQDAEKLEFQVLEDAAPGTLIVDTEDVVIDASVQKQLEVLEQAVQDARYERNM